MVHGLHGNRYDMRGFKNNLSLIYPHIVFLISESNEDKTEGDINQMAENLKNVFFCKKKEVLQFIDSNKADF
jgi:hypothetical protein